MKLEFELDFVCVFLVNKGDLQVEDLILNQHRNHRV